MRGRSWLLGVVVVVLLGSVCGACSPQPTAETSALEPYLLALDDVGEGFIEERGGQVSYALGHFCPNADVSIDNVGAVKAAFVKPSGEYEVSVAEHLWTDSPDQLDTFMADLKSAFAACDGVAWEYYGETMVREVIDSPALGDDRIAVREWSPDDDSDVVDRRILFVRHGDTVASVSIEEGRSDWAASRAFSDEDCIALVSSAIAKLSN